MRVAIIGGGAAGMMCAASLQEENPSAEILLFDRNDGLGKKVIISGGGRCNVTTGIHDVKTLLTKYPRGGKFLTSAMYAFPPDAVYAWFESHGVPLKMQSDLRAFPQSDDGHDIVGVFENLFVESRVNVMLKASVTAIETIADEFAVHVKHHDEPMMFDAVVLTTGGQAYRQTGSTGDGYAFAQSFGHTITKLAPSLNSFTTLEQWPATISGLSFAHAALTAKREGRPTFTGPFLFTHKGASGPAVFALSSLVAFESYGPKEPLDITIDVFPDATIDWLRDTFAVIAAEHPNKQFANVLGLLVPHSLAEIAVRENGISESKRVNQVAKKEIQQCILWLKAIPLTVIGRGAGDEFVTAGGVELSEIDPKTMMSTLQPGLFFAGEIMNVDGFTGGFNLQASWAAGRLAGQSVAAYGRRSQ
jgi:predicted Rossmann fold flavoprotein